jgi:hypothetical protein
MGRALKPIPLRIALVFGLASLGLAAWTALAQAPTTDQPWAYQLVSDSYLLDDCLICDRIPIQVPMRGQFNLRLVAVTPLVSQYALEDIHFSAGDQPYRVAGSGTFEIGGELAVVLRMTLALQIDDGFTNRFCSFTNITTTVDRPRPMLDVTLGQTNGTPAHVYTLRLAAAPVRDLWFSTVNFFTATAGPVASNIVQGGDLISTSGRVVKRNAQLYTSVGAMPPGPDLGLDAVDMLPGGEIAFSIGYDIVSETLGPLQHGDLLSTQGRVIRRNQDLLASFGIQPSAPDVGLDAVHLLDSSEVLFSITASVFSEKLGATLQPGDLLSSAGLIIRSSQQLLAHFHPTNAISDYGLDALYVWPSGELWFSTQKGFQDAVLGPIAGGDLLSDQGYIAFRNADLVSAFVPTNAPADIGLDALYVITDATAPTPASQLAIEFTRSSGSVTLTWRGQGRVFQVERADDLTGSFLPLSPILPELVFEHPGALTNRAQSYYRLRQW